VDKGTLVEVKLHGDRRLAVVERPEGKKHIQVIDENGTPHVVHPREVEYVVKLAPDSDAPAKYSATQIPKFTAAVEQYIDPSALELAWELLSEEQEAVSPEQLANLLFSDTSPIPTYAAYKLLSEDKLYFKSKGQVYEPRSPAQVAELKHQIEIAQQRAQEADDFLQKLRDKLSGEAVEWTNNDRRRLESLERYATHGDEASDKSVAIDILKLIQRDRTDTAAFDLLVDLGIWSVHENMFLRRSQVPSIFPEAVVARAQECFDSPIADLMERIDLTHLHVYTIDDETTTEIDDGLSVETLADGNHKLWIHIADPTRWLEPGDLLDLEARRRGTSLYLPTGMIPMFPPLLATGPMSLVQKQVCHALSFAVELDQTGAIVDFNVHASMIKPNYRLTYEDAEEMLQLGVEKDLDLLAHYARLRNQWRRSQGAININLPETIVKVDPNDTDQLTLQLLENSFSRQLVAEMMILAGEVGAKYAQAHHIPVPYRFQEQPDLPSEELILQLPPGPVREFAICRKMTRGELSINPFRHAGLGLDAYVQVTSPIRRYSDLLAHFQIKAHLRGAALPYTNEELDTLLKMIDPATYEANQIERQTVRYWSLEYLRRQGKTVWQALLLDWLREDERLGLVLLEDLGLKLPIRMMRDAYIGESLNLVVSNVDPRRDIINFEVVHTAMLQAN
jgi:exoribonuclease-2